MTLPDPMKTPAEHASAAAEAIRHLNHATQFHKSELVYPSNAYDVIGALHRLAYSLPQAFEQIGAFLKECDETGYVTADHGTTYGHITEARSALASSALIAQTLAEHLGNAHTATAPLGWAGTTEDDDCEEADWA
ncbi:hypothetical protein [Streptomyces indicus]|uniref:Uncharacterized protein n=1 Tax=Streptomyces indicus TaxID=417292 RepID=A0A1G9ETI1_9ACTN|nr:hypothetical protein [Streptomyces indicus]SDK79315.1 hypothetical protein SAMN05421806_11248 [Streptomyces indicus]